MLGIELLFDMSLVPSLAKNLMPGDGVVVLLDIMHRHSLDDPQGIDHN